MESQIDDNWNLPLEPKTNILICILLFHGIFVNEDAFSVLASKRRPRPVGKISKKVHEDYHLWFRSTRVYNHRLKIPGLGLSLGPVKNYKLISNVITVE